MSRRVRQLMSHKPQIVRPDTSLAQAAELMDRQNVGTLLVSARPDQAIRPEDLVGIVSDRDIVIRCIARARDPEIFTVSQAMSTPVFGCMENDDLTEAVSKMQDLGVRRLAVFGNDTNQLTGVISLDDIAEDARKELAGIALSEIAKKRRAG